MAEESQEVNAPEEKTKPSPVNKKGKVLKKIGQIFKGKIAAKSQEKEKVIPTPPLDKKFIQNLVDSGIEKKIADPTDQTTLDNIIDDSKALKESEKKEKDTTIKEQDYGKIIDAGTTGLQSDVQKVSQSVDSLIKVNQSILNSTENIVKCLNDIKSILLKNVGDEKQQLEDSKAAAEEASMDATTSSSGTQQYVKTYDDTPGNDNQQGGGQNLFDKVVGAVDFADDVFDISRHLGGKKRKGLRGNRAYGKLRRSRPGRFLGGRFNLARGLRSRRKLSEGAFMGLPQPVMVGEAGPEIVTPPKLAGGGLQAGIYDNPTKGKLQPGQSVIPLNRNSGKSLMPQGGMKKEGEGFGLAQPLATAMTVPFKAVGGALFGIASSFLPMLGPFAGILKPFLSFLIRPLGKILGVSPQALDAAMGASSPTFSLGNIFKDIAKTFNIGGDAKVDEKGNVSGGTSGSDVEPALDGPVPQGNDADFWSLAAIASREDVKPQGSADVAQSIYNRKVSGAYGGNSIKDLINSSGQYEPTFGNKGAWRAIKDRATAIRAAGSATNVDQSARAILNPQLQSKARSFVQGRTDFLGETMKKNMRRDKGDITRGTGSNFFGWHNNYKDNKVAQVPNFNVTLKAESGTSTGSDEDSSYMIKGPNSGYPIKITTNDGATTDVVAHGKESVHIGDSGFTILPHENNKWSVSKNPFETFNQWNEVLDKPSNEKGATNTPMKMESGGVHRRPVLNDWRAATARRQTRQNARNRTAQRERLGVFRGSNGRWQTHGVSDAAVGSNPWWQVWNKKGATAERRKKQEALAKSLADRMNREEDNIRRLHPAAAPQTRRAIQSGSSGSSGTGGSKPSTAPAKAPEPKAPALDATLTPMQNWAKLFPDLAKKVKPGQSGYDEIQAYFTKQKFSAIAGKGFELAAKGTTFVTAPAKSQTYNDLFKTGGTTPAATAAIASTAFSAATQLVQTKPTPVPVQTPTPQPQPYVPTRETICQIRQRDMLARL